MPLGCAVQRMPRSIVLRVIFFVEWRLMAQWLRPTKRVFSTEAMWADEPLSIGGRFTSTILVQGLILNFREQEHFTNVPACARSWLRHCCERAMRLEMS